MSLAPGQTVLDRYVVDALLGAGGMGEVYRAHHAHLDMAVALKIIVSGVNPDLVTRFQREAKLMAKVRHPNVVAVLDYGILPDGAPCIVMEYLEGEDLSARLARRGRLPWGEALDLTVDILSGLAIVHDADIVHRDIKPSNVMFAAGGRETPKLIDFGIARSVHGGVTPYTQSGAIIGTPAYMAPEQFLGRAVDRRTDLYAVALVFYEAVMGALPHGSMEMAAVLKRVSGEVPRLAVPAPWPQPPDALDEVLATALAVEPAARPQSALALIDELRSAARRIADPGGVGRAAGVSDAAHVGAAGASAAQPSLVVGARVPPSRLALKDERRWLSDLAGAAGRGFVLGAQHWFAVQATAPGAQKACADAITRALRERYGAATPVAWEAVGPDFKLSAAALTGAEPLPAVLARLLAGL
jgi:serine/threonine-protein kinase